MSKATRTGIVRVLLLFSRLMLLIQFPHTRLLSRRSRACAWLPRPFAVFFVVLMAGAVQAESRLAGFRFDTKEDYTRFVFEFGGPFQYVSHDEQVANGYYYIDLKNVELYGVREESIRIDDQRVLAALIRVFRDAGVLRLVLNTDGVHPVVVSTLKGPDRLVVDVYDRGKRPSDATHTPASESWPPSLDSYGGPASGSAASARIRSIVPRASKPGSKFLVVIDPGHGGHSTGAKTRTSIGGQKRLEKDIALALSLELKRLIDADPTIDCYLTRTRDEYVSLDDRVEMAEKLRADLFLSVHLNSIPTSSQTARGIEFYYVNTRGAGQLEGRMASRVQGGPSTVASSVKRLARSKVRHLVDRSASFCKLLETASTRIPFFRGRNRGVKTANFVVLKNAYMPTALIEVCFLSNDEDARFIVQPSNQKQVARAMYEAIRAYRDRYATR